MFEASARHPSARSEDGWTCMKNDHPHTTMKTIYLFSCGENIDPERWNIIDLSLRTLLLFCSARFSPLSDDAHVGCTSLSTGG